LAFRPWEVVTVVSLNKIGFRDWANINAALAVYETELEAEIGNERLSEAERSRLQMILTRVSATRAKVYRRLRVNNGSGPDPLG
jgi:hypothetical protein